MLSTFSSAAQASARFGQTWSFPAVFPPFHRAELHQVSLERRLFHTDGTIARHAPCYVERQADTALFANLVSGEPCYVLSPRQMGKSSLMVRTAARLRSVGFTVAVIDLTGRGTNVTPDQWYNGLTVRIADQLGMEYALDRFWDEHQALAPVDRFLGALEKVVLPQLPGKLVLFFDEIDAIRNLPFPTHEFFSALHVCLDRRVQEPTLARLAFCLLGSTTPAELFGSSMGRWARLGRAIELNDFTLGEVQSLASGLEAEAFPDSVRRKRTEVASRIYYWTQGHPYLTQRLCHETANQFVNAPGSAFEADRTGEMKHAGKLVDAICREAFLSPAAAEQDDNLLYVRNRVLRSQVDPLPVLNLYRDIHRQKNDLPWNEQNPMMHLLRLAGLVRLAGDRVAVRNRIYHRVFNGRWIKSQLAMLDPRRRLESRLTA